MWCRVTKSRITCYAKSAGSVAMCPLVTMVQVSSACVFRKHTALSVRPVGERGAMSSGVGAGEVANTMATRRLVLGVDIGGTRVKCGLIDLEHKAIVIQTALLTNTEGQSALVQSLVRMGEMLCDRAGTDMSSLLGVGVGVPGCVDGDEISMVAESIAFLEGNTFRDELQAALGLPVRLDNDARLIALGETLFGGHGPGQGVLPRRLLSLTLGTGLGVALVVDGHLQERSSVTHLAGHIPIRPGAAPCFCGFQGCLESLVGASALPRNYRQALDCLRLPPDTDDPDSQRVFALAAQGSAAALHAVRQMLDDLIVGLNAFIYVYAPEVIVLGGGIAHGLHKWLPSIREGLFARPYAGYAVSVCLSALGEQAGLWGAASLWEETDDLH